ncbi:MAG: hypothetical protein EXS36_04350 [Pedosphaera sp.]|nr:hypothetical protein [Pedosphaera sp.]
MDLLAYWLARGLVILVSMIPLRGVARIGRFGGTVAWWIDRRHRHVALANLRIAFPDGKSDQDLVDIARENFRRLGENSLCAIRCTTMTAEQLARHLTWSNLDTLPEQGSSLVAAIGHFGNFELYARVNDVASDWASATTYRALRQPALNGLMLALRERSKVQFFERRSGARALRQVLARGKVIVGLLADQNAGKRGIRLPFFGRECSCSAAPALLALRYRLPLQVWICFRTGLAAWNIRGGIPIATQRPGGSPRTLEEITADIQGAYESAIREDPANWFWFHRRWKLSSNPQASETPEPGNFAST